MSACKGNVTLAKERARRPVHGGMLQEQGYSEDKDWDGNDVLRRCCTARTEPDLVHANSSHRVTATDSGIPSAVILLITFTATIASLFWAAGFLERGASPIRRL